MQAEMTVSELIEKLRGLTEAASQKGIVTPSVNIAIQDHGRHVLWLHGKGIPRVTTGCTNFYGDTATHCVDQATAFIAALPDAEETHRNEFLRRVGDAADYGRQHGIDSDFVNPLTEAMKRLSANAIAAE